MNFLGAILGIKINLSGLSSVLSGLRTLDTSLTSARGKTRLLTNATYALGAAGAAIALSSIPAYESLEKTRRSFVAFTDEARGNSLARWLSDFSLEANTSTDALSSAATRWISATGDTSKVRDLVTGLEKLGGLGKSTAELQRIGKAIADIQGSSKFRAQELNQLVQGGVPGNLIAKQLGVPNLAAALGRPSEEVVNAILKAFNALPKQGNLFTQQLKNLFEGWQLAIAPTGARLTQIFSVIAVGGKAAIGVFMQLNKFTSGWAGVLLTISLLAPALLTVSTALGTLIPLMSQFVALQRLSVFWGTLWNFLNGGWAQLPGLILKVIGVIRAMISIQKIQVAWAAVGAALMGNWVGLATAAAIAAGFGVAFYYSNKSEQEEERKARQTTAATPAAKRPQRRDSWENIWMDRVGAMNGA